MNIIIGASSAIAQALATELVKQGESYLALSRKPLRVAEGCYYLHCDYSKEAFNSSFAQLPQAPIKRVFICNGLLHDGELQPEKRLAQLNAEHFIDVIQASTLGAALCLQQLLPILRRQQQRCDIAVFSARLGSIGDNQLGGWYSYRAAKAALNMLLKTAAIEYRRLAPQVKLLAFHPGTTDTPLSKPFQARIPQGKLLSPAFVAKRLLMLQSNLALDGQLSYLDWQGKTILW